MPLPRISGVLNNCPLHVLTPELYKQIELIANRKYQPTDGYELLKTTFAEFYGIEPSCFSWKDFKNCLEFQNPFDLQLVLGPVLRRFMAKNMYENLARNPAENEVYNTKNSYESSADDTEVETISSMSAEQFITYMTELHTQTSDEAAMNRLYNFGRYLSLSPIEMAEFVAEPLDIRVAWVQDGVTQTREAPLSSANPPIVTMYHQGGVEGAQAGGHFELCEGGSNAIDYQFEPDARLQNLAELFNLDVPELSEIGLDLLRDYITIINSPNVDRDQQLADFNLGVAQIIKFHWNSLFLPKERAKQYLGQLSDNTEHHLSRLPATYPHDDLSVLLNEVLTYQRTDESEPHKPNSNWNEYHYNTLLAILTPPLPQSQVTFSGNVGETQNDESNQRLWVLNKDEILALERQQIAETAALRIIINNRGLSTALYRFCNMSHITDNLSNDFLDLLCNDPNFESLANETLLRRCAEIERVNNAETEYLMEPSSPKRAENLTPNPNTPHFRHIYNPFGAFSETNPLLNAPGSQQSPFLQNAYFCMKVFQTFLALGATCALVIAILTCPPVAAVLGLSSIGGILVADIATKSAVLGLGMFATALSMFAFKPCFSTSTEQSRQYEPVSGGGNY